MRHLPLPPKKPPRPPPLIMQLLFWVFDTSQLAFIFIMIYLCFKSPLQDPELAEIMKFNLSWSHQLVWPPLLLILAILTCWINYLRLKIKIWQKEFWVYMGCILVQGFWGLLLSASLIVKG